jgi:hypothetical protein
VGIHTLLGLRNGLTVMMRSSSVSLTDDEKEQLEHASHVYLHSIVGFTILAGPFYWQWISWRALFYRAREAYIKSEVTYWLLCDVLYGECGRQ